MVFRLTFSHSNYAFFSESQSGPAKNVIIQKSNRQSACICGSWQYTVSDGQLTIPMESCQSDSDTKQPVIQNPPLPK